MRQAHDDPSVRDAETVARSLRTDVDNGLTAQEAERRLAEVGRNELHVTPPPSVWRRISRQFRDPLVYLLLAAIAISLSVWAIEGETGIPVDAIVIALIVVINAVLGFLQEVKAANAVAALARMTESTSAVVRDGRPRRIPSSELVPGGRARARRGRRGRRGCAPARSGRAAREGGLAHGRE